MPDTDPEVYGRAASSALAHFPVTPGALDLVAISENVTFRVTDADGRGVFVLRLHRPGYNSLEELEAERCWTRALNKAGVCVPEGVRSTAGPHFRAVAIPEKREQRYAGLTRWIEGEVLSARLDAPETGREAEQAFEAIGRIAATLHLQARDWQPPPGFERPRLDVGGLLGEAPRWGRFWEHPALGADERQHLLALRAEARTKLLAHGTDATVFGLIHADLHADNILLREDGVGIIDFDDAAFGWYVYDLATALADVLERPDYAALRDALLAGYERLRPLADEDRALLDVLVLVRSMSLIGWLAERPEYDDGAYLEALRQRLGAVSSITDF